MAVEDPIHKPAAKLTYGELNERISQVRSCMYRYTKEEEGHPIKRAHPYFFFKKYVHPRTTMAAAAAATTAGGLPPTPRSARRAVRLHLQRELPPLAHRRPGGCGAGTYGDSTILPLRKQELSLCVRPLTSHHMG